MNTVKIAVLSADMRGWHARDLARAAAPARVELEFFDLAQVRAEVGGAGRGAILAGGVLAGGARLDGFPVVLVRSIPAGTLEQVVFRMDALQRLEAAGAAVVNPPRAIEAAVDKYFGLARIAEAGVEAPRTRVAQSAAAAMEDFEALGGDTVVKPLFGSAGRGIFRASDPELAGRAFRALERLGSVIYQQEYVELGDGDLRVLVIGGEAVLGMRRRATASGEPPQTEWRTNVARGGFAAPHRPSAVEAEAAVRAAAALGAEVAGVDLLPAADGRLLVSEVNSAPGWRALARVTGADVARLVLEHARRRASR